jgi:hypothetical protein
MFFSKYISDCGTIVAMVYYEHTRASGCYAVKIFENQKLTETLYFENRSRSFVEIQAEDYVLENGQSVDFQTFIA